MVISVKIVSRVKDWPAGVFRIEGSPKHWVENRIEIRQKGKYRWTDDDQPTVQPTLPIRDMMSALRCALDLGYTRTSKSVSFFEDSETLVHVFKLLK